MRKLALLGLMALSSIVLFAESEYTYNSTTRTYDYTGQSVSALVVDFSQWALADLPTKLADDMPVAEKDHCAFMKWKILENNPSGRQFGTCNVLFNNDNDDFPDGPKNTATTNAPRIYLPTTVGGIKTLSIWAGGPGDAPLNVYYKDSKHGVWTLAGTVTVLKNKYQEYTLAMNTEGATTVYIEHKSGTWLRIMQINADIIGGDVPVTGLTLNLHEYDIQLNSTLTLTATIEPEDATDKTVTWSSSDESILTVDNGVVTAKALGVATIYAHAGVKVDSCVLTVRSSVVLPTAITWNVPGKELTMKMGETTTVSYTITPANSTRTSVILMSGDDRYATITQEGLITAVGGGTVTMTAILDDLTDEFTLHIIDPDKPVGELDWDQDGTYWGDKVSYVYADFTQWPLTALSDTIQDEIQQYKKLGFIRYKMANRGTYTEAGWDNTPVNCLFSDQSGSIATRPVMLGENDTYRMIYLPTLKKGAGAIRITGNTGAANGCGFGVSFYNVHYSETEAGYTYIKGINCYSKGIYAIESDLNIPDTADVTLQISQWQGGVWPVIWSVQVSPYGYPLSDDPDKDFGPMDAALNDVKSNAYGYIKMIVDGQFVIVRKNEMLNAQGMVINK